MLVSDFVLLGVAVPEPATTGTAYICTLGVSAEHGLLRVYPTHLANRRLKRWEIGEVHLDKASTDTRQESWTLMVNTAGKAPYKGFKTSGSLYPKSRRADLLEPHLVSSIDSANEKRLSIALIQLPEKYRFFLEENEGWQEEPWSHVYREDSKWRDKSKEKYRYKPRIAFSDAYNNHQLQLRDWGIYELMRKQAPTISEKATKQERTDYIGGRLGLSKQPFLLIGNQNAHRTSWMVISVISKAMMGVK
jgi:hypothetical protein